MSKTLARSHGSEDGLEQIVVILQITCKILEVFLWFGHGWAGQRMDLPQDPSKTVEEHLPHGSAKLRLLVGRETACLLVWKMKSQGRDLHF